MPVKDGDYQARIIEDAPTFYWRLDNDYTDAIGNAAVGVPVNGVFSTPKFGVSSAYLNNTDGYINIPNHALMSFSTNIDFSIELWHKKTSAAGSKYIISHMSGFNTGWSVQHDTTDHLILKIAATTFTASTAAIPEDSNFHHLVVAVDRDANVTYYIDNVAQVIATVPNANSDATSNLTIGARSDTGETPSYGYIDEVSVYRKLLTAADVDRHYKSGNKHYNGNVAVIDTVGFDIDIAEQMFGLSNAPINIKSVRFYKPTAADALVLRDKSGNVVVELLCTTTNKDVFIEFDEDVLRCQGLRLVATDNTMTTGNALVTFA